MTSSNLPNDLATAIAARRSELELEAQRALDASRQQFAAAHMTCVERASQPRIEVDLERIDAAQEEARQQFATARIRPGRVSQQFEAVSPDDVEQALERARQQFAAARTSCVEDAQSAFETNRIEIRRISMPYAAVLDEAPDQPEPGLALGSVRQSALHRDGGPEQALERARRHLAVARTSCIEDAQSAFETRRTSQQYPVVSLDEIEDRPSMVHGDAEQALEHARQQLAAARTSCVESALSIVESNRIEIERASQPHLDAESDRRRGSR